MEKDKKLEERNVLKNQKLQQLKQFQFKKTDPDTSIINLSGRNWSLKLVHSCYDTRMEL